LYAKKDKEKKKDNKKKIFALSAFLAPYLITTASAFYLLAINSKIAVISIGKKVNLRRFNEFWLKLLVKKEYCFIYKE